MIKLGPSLAAIIVWMVGPENGGGGPMISGGPYQDRCQSADLPDDHLSNPIRG